MKDATGALILERPEAIFTVYARETDSHSPQLTFTACEPYAGAGAPTFPPVSESASNRLSCFCAKEQRTEAPIRLGPP